MKYYKRLKVYKASNVMFNPQTFEATSHDWWVFVKKINGTVLFNDYSYSNSTCRHQSKVRSLLNELKINYQSVTIPNAKDLNSLSKDTVRSIYKNLIELEIVVNSTKGKRLESYAHQSRVYQINGLKKDIQVLAKVGYKISKKEVKELTKKALSEEKSRLENLKQKKLERKAFLKRQFETNEAFNLNLGSEA